MCLNDLADEDIRLSPEEPPSATWADLDAGHSGELGASIQVDFNDVDAEGRLKARRESVDVALTKLQTVVLHDPLEKMSVTGVFVGEVDGACSFDVDWEQIRGAEV